MAKKRKSQIHEVKRIKDMENPIKGDLYVVPVSNPYIGKRLVTFKATGKKGFGMWKITKNVKDE